MKLLLESGVPLAPDDLRPDRALYDQIRTWREEVPLAHRHAREALPELLLIEELSEALTLMDRHGLAFAQRASEIAASEVASAVVRRNAVALLVGAVLRHGQTAVFKAPGTVPTALRDRVNSDRALIASASTYRYAKRQAEINAHALVDHVRNVRAARWALAVGMVEMDDGVTGRLFIVRRVPFRRRRLAPAQRRRH